MKKKAFFTMLAVVLVLVLSLTVFVACNKDKKDNTGETPATYSVTVNGGTGGGEYTAGATVKITANAPETGKEFTSWTIEGVTVDDKTNAEITFTMPANAVTATANYGDKAYLFALENCTADKESAKFGEQVTFTADEVIGKRFDSWNIKGVGRCFGRYRLYCNRNGRHGRQDDRTLRRQHNNHSKRTRNGQEVYGLDD